MEAPETIARVCFPDLAGMELRIVPAVAPMAGCYWSGWRSAGVVTVAVDDGLSEAAYIATLLHELCHWATANEVEPVVTFSEAATATIVEHSTPSPIPPALWMHADDFIRACVHCWFRSNRVAGYFIAPEWIGFASSYPTLQALSSPGHYIEALYSEVQEHRHAPLRTILATDPPATFAELWAADFGNVLDAALSARAAA